MTIIKLTDRALDDLDEIENYSVEQFGNKVANKYLNDIKLGLNLLQEDSGLLQEVEGFSGRLKFYRIRDYFLICSKIKTAVLVLTIKHVQMDVINNLREMEPALAIEVDLYVRKLK